MALVKTGLANGLRSFLQQHPEVLSFSDDSGWTLLHEASSLWNEKQVKLILDMTLSLSVGAGCAADAEGSTALHALCGGFAGFAGSPGLAAFQGGQDRGGAGQMAGGGMGSGPAQAQAQAVGERAERVIPMLLGAGISADTPDSYGNLPLHVAVAAGASGSFISALVRATADPNRRNLEGMAPIHMAAFLGRLEVLRALCEHDYVDAAAVDSQGRTALHHAAMMGCEKEAKFLLEVAKLKFGLRDRAGCTALHYAASVGSHAVLHLLLRAGARVSARDAGGYTALHYAAMAGDPSIIRLLLLNKAAVRARSFDGQTPAMLAAAADHDRAVALLSPETPLLVQLVRQGDYQGIRGYFKSNLPADIVEDNGWSALHEACVRGEATTVMLLLRRGANANQKDLFGLTPLHMAAATGAIEAVRVLVEEGAPLDAAEADGLTPLHLAARRGYMDVVGYLLEAGSCAGDQADLTGRRPKDYARDMGSHLWVGRMDDLVKANRLSVRPLHAASLTNDLKTLRVTLARGKWNIDERDPDRNTALHVAVAAGSFDCMRHLVEHGAAVNTHGAGELTALHLACQEVALEATKVLLQAGARCDVRSATGALPIHSLNFAHRDQVALARVIAMLAERYPQGVQTVAQGSLPLHLAARADSEAATMELLRCGAEDAPDWEGRTAYQICLEVGNERSARVLCPVSTAWQRAALRRDSAELGNLLAEPDAAARAAGIEERNSFGQTPLFLAALAGWGEGAERLVAAGAQVAVTDRLGFTALHTAVGAGSVRVAEVLVRAGASVHTMGSGGRTALHMVNYARSPAAVVVGLVRLLCEAGADTSARNSTGEGPLHLAAAASCPTGCAALLRYGALKTAKRSDGATPRDLAEFADFAEGVAFLADTRDPLYEATQAGRADEVRRLLAGGHAPVRGHPRLARRHGGETPLHAAVRSGQDELVAVLLHAYADPGARNSLGQTPLHVAAMGAGPEVCHALLAFGAMVHEADLSGATALHHACQAHQNGIVEVLHSYGGACVYHADNAGKTPLDVCEAAGNAEALAILAGLQLIRPIQVPLHYFSTSVDAYYSHLRAFPVPDEPLLAACLCDDPVELAKRLSSIKWNPLNVIDDKNRGPLHYAAISGSARCTEFLLSLPRASHYVNAPDSQGYRPLHFAAAMGMAAVVDLLVSHGADVTATTHDGRTPLHTVRFAALETSPSLVKAVLSTLLGAGADPNAKDRVRGFTPLHLAAASLNVIACALLVARGATNVDDDQGLTPYMHVPASDAGGGGGAKGGGGGGGKEVVGGAGFLARGSGSERTKYEMLRSLLLRLSQTDSAVSAIRRSAPEAELKMLVSREQRREDGSIADRGELLLEAAGLANAKAVGVLLSLGLNAQAQDPLTGWTALHLACFSGGVDCARVLIRHGAGLGHRTKDGETALHVAVRSFQNECVSLLLHAGADVAVVERSGRNPLQAAVIAGNVVAVELLLGAGADRTIMNGDLAPRWSVSPLSPSYRNEIRMAVLLAAPTEVNTAVLTMDEAALEKLIVERVRRKRNNNNNNNKKMGRAKAGEGRSAKSSSLTSSSSSSSSSSLSSSSLASQASSQSQARRARRHHRGHHGMNTTCPLQRTAAHVAAKLGFSVGLELLLGPGRFDPNARDALGATPLHLASNASCVAVLLAYGADATLTTASGSTPLHTINYLALNRDGQELREHIAELVAAGCNVNATNSQGLTALHIAAWSGSVIGAATLIEHGASKSISLANNFEDDDNIVNNHDGRTATQSERAPQQQQPQQQQQHRNGGGGGPESVYTATAVSNPLLGLVGSTRAPRVYVSGRFMLKSLVHARAGQVAGDLARVLRVPALSETVEARPEDWLLEASQRNDEAGLERALNAGLGYSGRSAFTPLHAAAMLSTSSNAARLLAKGAKVEARDSAMMTPLHLAARHGCPETVSLLLEAGASVQVKDRFGATPLHGAVEAFRGANALLLLSAGALPGAVDRLWRTVLHTAAASGNLPAIKLLVSFGADVGAKDFEGHTPTVVARRAHQYACAEALIVTENSGDPKFTTAAKETELHVAVLEHRLVRCRYLVLSGEGDPDYVDDHGFSPFTLAALSPQRESIARLLCDLGANIDQRDRNGDTAVHLAVRMDLPDRLSFLLSLGCDRRLKNSEGRTPIELARALKRETCARRLTLVPAEVGDGDKMYKRSLRAHNREALRRMDARRDYLQRRIMSKGEVATTTSSSSASASASPRVLLLSKVTPTSELPVASSVDWHFDMTYPAAVTHRPHRGGGLRGRRRKDRWDPSIAVDVVSVPRGVHRGVYNSLPPITPPSPSPPSPSSKSDLQPPRRHNVTVLGGGGAALLGLSPSGYWLPDHYPADPVFLLADAADYAPDLPSPALPPPPRPSLLPPDRLMASPRHARVATGAEMARRVDEDRRVKEAVRGEVKERHGTAEVILSVAATTKADLLAKARQIIA